MAIKILDAATIGKIAAGEVVERPASVVKELVENSIDAGATSITVEIQEGGTGMIRIIDNGCGIPAEETRIAFTNHATSKLRNADMLTDIRTLGFRGEALASVSAVAKVEMRTRTKGAESGTQVRVEGGIFLGSAEIGCPEGTTITVRDLFYNVPARKAFLKRPAYEAGAVNDVVTRMVLGNPSVSFRLISNGRTVIHSFGDGKLKSAAIAVFGRETTAGMQEADISEGAFRLTGLIGMGDLARQNRSMQFFFINGRTIKCQMLTYALEAAVKERIGIGMHPICALHVHIPAATVDVNVHPSKLEVRFRDEQAFRNTSEQLLQIALNEKKPMLNIGKIVAQEEKKDAEKELERQEREKPANVLELTATEKLAKAREYAQKKGIQLEADEKFFASMRPAAAQIAPTTYVAEEPAKVPIQPSPTAEGSTEQRRTEISDIEPKTLVRPAEAEQASMFSARSTSANEDRNDEEKVSYRIIGVFLRTYLILEAKESLILIDQHAAHERIMYERYKKALDVHAASQRLLLPILLKATEREIAILNENRSLLAEAGYDISVFGEHDIRVDAVPFILGESDTRLLFAEMIEDLGALKSAQLDKRMQAIIKLSCRKAVKGGDALTAQEVDALVSEMMIEENLSTCPHGRPVARVITRKELEKMFWRI